ncbi:MAG: M28 family peptidase [Candidatus Marinimicrobia bacterium]|nr:M28 family peptidase [Candidatus Neomarinimicrobiota bacterium]
MSWLLCLLLALPGSLVRAQAPFFDGEQAYSLLIKQVAMGPRNPGSEGHAAITAFLRDYLSSRAEDVVIQSGYRRHPYSSDTLTITNIIGRFNMAAVDRVLLLAHYDTRDQADLDPDSALRSQPIPGANDGASGVAVLLTLADLMATQLPRIGVDLLFTDAEDMGRSGDLANFCLGAKLFVGEMESLLGGRPRYAVLLDMIGDADLSLPIEYHSWRDARQLVMRIWQLAQDLGYEQFNFEHGPAIYDDHIPFLEAGIPAVDIIDFDYGDGEQSYWHTMADTPDKCSPESLAAVGTVVATLIYTEKP